MQKRKVSLSKFIALLLRHKPEQFGLVLDEEGYVPINELVSVINNHWKQDKEITANDIVQLVFSSGKKRFEIKGEKIRALYGHSPQLAPKYLPVEPPEILYHGTARRYLPEIKKVGLKPMGRRYVHLSATKEEAYRVGRRRDKCPLILKINARQAYLRGLPFFKASSEIYLSEAIPIDYIEEIEDKRA